LLLLLLGSALGFMPPTLLSRPRLRERPSAREAVKRPFLAASPPCPHCRELAYLRMTAPDDEEAAAVPLSPLRRNACIAVVLALFTVNQWSRSLVFYVVDFADNSQLSAEALAEASRLFINVELGFDQAQYGLLASLGFATLFSLTSLLAVRMIKGTVGVNVVPTAAYTAKLLA